MNTLDNVRNNLGLNLVEFPIDRGVAEVLSRVVAGQFKRGDQSIEALPVHFLAEHVCGLSYERTTEPSLTLEKRTQIIQEFFVCASPSTLGNDVLRLAEEIWRDNRLKCARLPDPHVWWIANKSLLQFE